MTDSMAIVTGAPGWLGTRLIETLIRGLPDVPAFADGSPERPMRALVLPDQASSDLAGLGGNLTRVEGDLTRAKSLEPLFEGAGGATVFHCAGVIHPTGGVKQFYAVNEQGTRNMIDAAERAGVRRFVHVSSNSPLGCNPSNDHRFDESSPYNPYMNYGRSKKLGEDLVNQARDRGKMETVMIRPPWFYGVRQPARQSLFFTMIKDGGAPIVGGGDNRRSMAYVDNICQGLMLCEVTPTAQGQTYWIADRRPYTMNEIVDTVERLLEKEFDFAVKHKRLRLPGAASEVALIVDKMLQGVGLYHQKIHVLSEMNKTIACSIAKAEAELGYDPKIDLEEGMRRSIGWVLEHGGQI
jgi:nucleoside-diphosphate-sugar epimerase